jgi:hypothetical protein
LKIPANEIFSKGIVEAMITRLQENSKPIECKTSATNKVNTIGLIESKFIKTMILRKKRSRVPPVNY